MATAAAGASRVFVSGKVTLALKLRGGEAVSCCGKGRKTGLLLSADDNEENDRNKDSSSFDAKGSSSHHSLSVVGATRPFSVEVPSISQVANRFVSDGKLTISTAAGDQIFLSNAMESHILDLVTALLDINSKIIVQSAPRGTSQRTEASGYSAPLPPRIMSHRPVAAQKVATEGLLPHRKRASCQSSLPPPPRKKVHESQQQQQQQQPDEVRGPSPSPSTSASSSSSSSTSSLHAVDKNSLPPLKTKKKSPLGSPDGFPLFDRIPEDILPDILLRCPNETLGVCRRFHKCVQTFRTKLKFTPRSGCNVPSEVICRTVQLSPRLKVLDLSGCSALTAGAMRQLASTPRLPRKLYVLILRGCFRLTDVAVRQVLYRLRGIEVLDLIDCSNLTNEALRPLARMKCLRRLSLGSSADAASQPHRAAVQLNGNELLLRIFGDVRPIALPSAADHAAIAEETNDESQLVEQLAMLTVSGSSGVSSGEPTSSPSDGMKLEQLVLANFESLKNLSPLINVANTLTYLDLRGSASVDDSCAEVFCHLKQLRTLCLAGCRIGDAVVYEVVGHCKRLAALDCGALEGLGISRTAVQALVLPPHGLTLLSRLKLKNSNGVDDGSFRAILAHAAELETLDVSNCWQLTNSALDHSNARIAAGTRLKGIAIQGSSIDRCRLERQLSRLLISHNSSEEFHTIAGVSQRQPLAVSNDAKVILPKVHDTRELCCVPLAVPSTLHDF